ncbi:MAG: hypothetical protein NXI24_23065 [bacterium]|nr:hypothetical protein [bacterium]
MNFERFARIFGRALIFTAIVAGVFFRFYNAEHKLLWHDEVYTQLFAAGTQAREWRGAIYNAKPLDVSKVQALTRDRPERGVFDTIRGLAEDEPQHPPVYYILARIYVAQFGDSIAVLRGLSAILSLLALPAMFWLCLELGASRRACWSGVALIAVSPFFVLYAQEARQYSLWAALIIALNAALLRALHLTESILTSKEQTPGNPRNIHADSYTGRVFGAWSVYAGFVALALYVSFSTAAVLFSQAIFVALCTRLHINRLSLTAAAAMTAGVALFAPWAYLLWRNLQAFSLSMAWSKVTTIPRIELFESLALNISRVFWNVDDVSGKIESPLMLIGVLATVGLTLYALFFVYKNAGPRRLRDLLFALFLIPIVMLLLPDLLFGGIRSISGRYLTPAWIAALCAVAIALDSPPAQSPRRFVISPGRALLFAILAAGLASCYANAQRQVVWTKGISVKLPKAAEIINQARQPLVVGDFERHHPGNLLALSHLLKAGTRLQFLPRHDPNYRLPAGIRNVFLYSPIPEFRASLRDDQGKQVESTLLLRGLYLDLWRVEQADRRPKN